MWHFDGGFVWYLLAGGPGGDSFLQIIIRPICEQAGQLVSWSAGQLVSAFDDISILWASKSAGQPVPLRALELGFSPPYHFRFFMDKEILYTLNIKTQKCTTFALFYPGSVKVQKKNFQPLNVEVCLSLSLVFVCEICFFCLLPDRPRSGHSQEVLPVFLFMFFCTNLLQCFFSTSLCFLIDRALVLFFVVFSSCFFFALIKYALCFAPW